MSSHLPILGHADSAISPAFVSSTAPCGAAEDAAREMRKVSLEDALRLVHPYAESGSPKFDAAAMRWLRRYLDEASPTLERFAETVMSPREARAVASSGL